MNLSQEKNANVSEQQSLKLVDGVFSPENAEDILLNMIQKKINYHNGLIFSTWERFGEACPDSEARLTALRNLRQEIQKLAEYGKENGMSMNVNCNIEISFTKEGPSCEA